MPEAKREEALPHSFVSAHMLLGITGGEFVSLLDPGGELSRCRRGLLQLGVFPVLAGEEPDRSMMLCSPIILYDYPKIAPESAGDFFDGTEMDEMLTLRVLTLTDAEKQEMRERRPPRAEDSGTDRDAHRRMPCSRRMASSAAAATFERAATHDRRWNPFEEARRRRERPHLRQSTCASATGCVSGPEEGRHHGHGSDRQDRRHRSHRAGFRRQIQFAVVLDDDPGREFGMMRQPGHRFFFSPEEVEPVLKETA